jgi:AraC-like DNA-binding protein
MNTSYMELVDESRKARAEEWVRGTPMTFEHIASELGFSNVRSFRRAFKRWTGRTPGAMRAVG